MGSKLQDIIRRECFRSVMLVVTMVLKLHGKSPPLKPLETSSKALTRLIDMFLKEVFIRGGDLQGDLLKLSSHDA